MIEATAPEVDPCWRQATRCQNVTSGRDTVEYVADAQLTAPESGRSEFSSGRTVAWHAGTVYDSRGQIIHHARRAGGYAGDFLHSLDQEYVELSLDCRRIDGSHYYGGLWMQNFGHFLIETLPTLWAHDGATPTLFHKLGSVDRFKLELLELSGVSNAPVFVEEATRVERLIVPSRPFVLNRACSQAAVRLWDRTAQAATGDADGTRRVWLSRSKAEAEQRQVSRTLGYRELDDEFRELGFEVIFPETLPVREQIEVARTSAILAGFEGSALHLSAFAHPGTKILMLGSERRPEGNRAQPIIDRAIGNSTVLVPFGPLETMMNNVRAIL